MTDTTIVIIMHSSINNIIIIFTQCHYKVHQCATSKRTDKTEKS